jgi:hypothetical protein
MNQRYPDGRVTIFMAALVLLASPSSAQGSEVCGDESGR